MHILKLFDSIFNYGLVFAIFFPFLVLWFKQKQYAKIEKCLSTISISIWLHILLKSTLRVQHPDFTHTFAIPSGHVYMNFATFGAFMLEITNKKSIAFVLSVLFAIFSSAFVLLLGYHQVIDCAVAILCCGAELLLLYGIIYKKLPLDYSLIAGIVGHYVVISLQYPKAYEFITKSRWEMILPSTICLLFLIYKKVYKSSFSK